MTETTNGSSTADQTVLQASEPFWLNTTSTRITRVCGYIGALVFASSFIYWAQNINEESSLPFLFLALGYALVSLVGSFVAYRMNLMELVGVLNVLTSVFVAVTGFYFLKEIGFDFGSKSNDAWFSLNTDSDFDSSNSGTSSLGRWINQGWMVLEAIFFIGSVAIYWAFRKPFQAFAVTTSALLLVDDGMARLVGLDKANTGPDETGIGVFLLCTALVLLIAGIIVDYRGLRRSALWSHLYAAFLFIPATVLIISQSFDLFFTDITDRDHAVPYLVVGAFLLLLAILLRRIVYVVFGALAVITGLGVLIDRTPSIELTCVMTAIGLLLICTGACLPMTKFGQRLATSRFGGPQRD